MDVALAVKAMLRFRNRIAVEIVGDEVFRFNETRREMARHHVFRRIAVVPDADVSERIHDAVLEENPVSKEQISDEFWIQRLEI